ncbi:MAG TPA: peptidylprolyl isomerase [Bacillota bacterium]|nr:peptidylprolyl isomerase [Bacillota bacterium]
MKHIKIGYLIMGICVVLMISGCGKSDDNASGNNASDVTSEEGQPIVTITMENGDTIHLELYPDIAPNTVNNFISLIKDDYYDGLIFHRVIPDFMIQGGDPEGNGSGGPGYTIAGEFSSNDFDNDLKHERGVLSMARSGDPDSAGSQFFIMVEEATHLDGEYAGFGKVIDGMDTVDDIVETETDQADKPVKEQKMKTVEVDLNGYDDYSEPEKIS